MGDNLFKKINNGETTVGDGKVLKLILFLIFAGGLVLGIAIGMD